MFFVIIFALVDNVMVTHIRIVIFVEQIRCMDTQIFVNAKCTSLSRAEGFVGSIPGHDKAISFN